MSNDTFLLVLGFVLGIAAFFGWRIIRRKHQQQKQRTQAVSEVLLCADCGTELKPVDGNPELYECPNCNRPGNLGQEVDPKCRL